jgi:hypothetical protein
MSAKPCTVGGGSFPFLVQQIIEQKLKGNTDAVSAALHFLISLGTSLDTTVDNDDKVHQHELNEDHLREQRMAWALRTIQRLGVSIGLTHQATVASSYHIERPPGCVLVPAVVGYTYVELQRCGYDAEAWWGGYYRRFVQPKSLPSYSEPREGVAKIAALGSVADPTSRAHDGIVSCAAHVSSPRLPRETVSWDAVPQPCWRRAPQPPHLNGSSDDALYAKPVSLRSCRASAALAKWSTSVPRRSEASYWIPLSLLSHLPFFPFPHPEHKTNCVDKDSGGCNATDATGAGDGNAVNAGFYDALLGPPAYAQEGEEETENRTDGLPHCAASPFFRRGWRPWSASTSFVDGAGGHCIAKPQPVFNSSLWLQPFYDTLFLTDSECKRCWQSIQRGSQRPATGSRRYDAITLQWHHQMRANCPLRTPWRFAPHLLKDAQADSARTTAPPPSWPTPSTELVLGNYQPFLTFFWSRKGRVALNLPRPYAFPFTSYPFLFAQTKGVQTGAQVVNTRGYSEDHAAVLAAFQVQSRCSSGFLHRQPAAQSILPHSYQGEPSFRHYGSNLAARDVDVCSPFAALGEWWRLWAVTVFGRKYIPVRCTTLACIFDSAVCVHHAIPLNVYGAPFVSACNATRHRQQRYAPWRSREAEVTSRRGSTSVVVAGRKVRAATAPTASSCAPSAEKRSAATSEPSTVSQDHHTSVQRSPSPPSRSPWLARLLEVRMEQQRTLPNVVPQLTHAAMLSARQEQRGLQFLFRSPYWVEVHGLYERWGVHVAPGVSPLRVHDTLLVNAEQTTDASRFTPATCVPHLQQQVLFCDALLHCTWAMSQHLLSILAPAAQPRQSSTGANLVWTYETLKERAAAAQQVSNLWIAEEMVKSMDWTLRPRLARATTATTEAKTTTRESRDPAATETILHAVLPLQSISLRRLEERLTKAAQGKNAESLVHPCSHTTQSVTPCLFAHLSADAPGTLPENLPHQQRNEPPLVTVFHSSCVVEQDQLVFVATYAPVVLCALVPSVTVDDLCSSSAAGIAKTLDQEAFQSLLKRVDAVLKATSGDTEKEAWAAHKHDSAPTLPDREAPTSEQEIDSGGDGISQRTKRKEMDVSRYLAVAKAKRNVTAAPWHGSKLTLHSRLALARLALQKGYRQENARRWVSLDFLRSEPRVRLVAGSAQKQQQESATPPLSRPFCRKSSDGSLPGGANAGAGPTVGREVTAVQISVVVPDPANEKQTDNEWAVSSSFSGFLDGDGKDTFFFNSKHNATMTVVNWEELEWPDDISHVERLMWLFKEL